ncbi:MAG: hypothetical protein J7K73_00755 [Nanoarchaeota archaeon]|nr:hypothetical protein [Nanoarchaeota archaeon]
MGLEKEIEMKVRSSGLVRILEKLDAAILTPREVVAKLKHKYHKEEPHLEIERDVYKVYDILKSLGYAVDIKDFTHPFLSAESLGDGVIPEYDFGEDIVAAKAIRDGRRIHARMWKDKTNHGEKCYRVEVHTEVYPTTGKLRYPKTFIQWLKRASLHIRDPHANYREGAEIFKEEIDGLLTIYYVNV